MCHWTSLYWITLSQIIGTAGCCLDIAFILSHELYLISYQNQLSFHFAYSVLKVIIILVW